MPRLSILMIVKLGLVGLAVLFYLISVVSPAYYQIAPKDTIHGFECLLLGWLSLFYNPINLLPWFSNFFFLACIPMGFFRITGFIAIPIGVAAIIMAIPALFIFQLMYNENGMITSVDILYGTYIWLLSYFLLFASLLIPARWNRQPKPIPEPEPDINTIP